MNTFSFNKAVEKWGVFEFRAGGKTEGNHGPLKIVDTYHFRYADGTPYYSLGTTCYAWVHQSEESLIWLFG